MTFGEGAALTCEQIDSRSVAMFDLEQMALILGDVNTEAKCLAIGFTPQERVSVLDIRESLSDSGAFDLVPQSRFNVQGILSKTNDGFVTVVSEPIPEKHSTASWAQRNPDFAGDFIAGLAGDLITYSIRNNRSLRTIIGEKRLSANNANAILNRLGILTGILSLTIDSPSTSGSFSTEDLVEFCFEHGDEIETSRSLINKHIGSLKDKKVVDEKLSKGKQVIRTSVKPDGTEAYHDVHDLLRIVGTYAVGRHEDISAGISSGIETAKCRNNVALLVKRSYATSGHTGKTTPRKAC